MVCEAILLIRSAAWVNWSMRLLISSITPLVSSIFVPPLRDDSTRLLKEDSLVATTFLTLSIDAIISSIDADT